MTARNPGGKVVDQPVTFAFDPDVGKSLRDAVAGATAKGMMGVSYQIEQYVKLYVKPRPRFMPSFLYDWLMTRVCFFRTIPFLTAAAGEEMSTEVRGEFFQRARDLQRASGVKDPSN